MLEECGKPAEKFAFLERFGDGIEILQRDACFRRATSPDGFCDLVQGELALESHQHTPLVVGELNDAGSKHPCWHFGAITRFNELAANVAHAQCEDPFGRHEAVAFCACDFKKKAAVFVEGLTRWDFDGCPKLVGFARDLGVGGANDDMSGEGILAEHKFKCGVEFFRCHLPSDERPFRKIGR